MSSSLSQVIDGPKADRPEGPVFSPWVPNLVESLGTLTVALDSHDAVAAAAAAAGAEAGGGGPSLMGGISLVNHIGNITISALRCGKLPSFPLCPFH